VKIDVICQNLDYFDIGKGIEQNVKEF